MAKLTEEQIKEYVARGGLYCPYCGLDGIEGVDQDVDGPVATWTVMCVNVDCRKSWTDIYTLTDMEPDEDDEEIEVG